MKIYEIGNKKYRLPNDLADFQLQMYVHLINWKWEHLTHEPGIFKNTPYDAFIPDDLKAKLYPIYPPIQDRFLDHQRRFPFKTHKFLGHMASSQAACVNLFMPLLQDPRIAAKVLRAVKTDIQSVATDHLDNGFRIEFWDEPDNTLNDHTDVSGTDADIAIAYYDDQGDLNLWLIEHKLTEVEFSTCNGSTSKGRTSFHACAPASAVLDDPSLCYYHSARKFRYWDETLKEASAFDLSRIRQYPDCPFMGGLNQLWRNQLLAASLESSTSPKWPYKKVFFSVVHHPLNTSLKPSIKEFRQLLGSTDRFFTFTSDQLIDRVKELDEPVLSEWVRWYQELYFF